MGLYREKESSQERDARLKASAIEDFKDHVLHKEEDRRWMIARHYKDGSFCSHFWTEIVVLGDNSLLVHGDIGPCIFSRCSYSDPLHVLQWVGGHHDIDYYLRQKANIGLGGLSPVDTFSHKVARWEIQEYRLKEYPLKTGLYIEWLEEVSSSSEDNEAIEYLSDLAWLPDLLIDNKLDGDLQLPTDETQKIGTFLWDNYNVDAAELQAHYNKKIEELPEKDEIYAVWHRALVVIDGYTEDSWGYVMFIDWLYNELCDAGEEDVGEVVSGIGCVPDSRLYYCWAAARRLLELLKEKEAKKENGANVDGESQNPVLETPVW